MGRGLCVCLIVLIAAGCSSSRPGVTVGAARTFGLRGFAPLRLAHPGPARLTFTIRQPSGANLVSYRRGAGPHTGVHLIVVRHDLSVIIHRHPPVGPDGRLSQVIDFPAPGPYRVLVDAFPAVKGAPRNFQLHEDVLVGGAYHPKPLPPFSPSVTVQGYHVHLSAPRRLHAIQPAHLIATVTDPHRRPLTLTPWYGALAHAVFFRKSRTLDYFHTHVCGPNTPGCTSIFGGAKVTGSSSRPGKLQVGVLLPVAGIWRLFLQFQAGGRILSAPFTLSVR
jgi:hypothetical protein